MPTKYNRRRQRKTRKWGGGDLSDDYKKLLSGKYYGKFYPTIFDLKNFMLEKNIIASYDDVIKFLLSEMNAYNSRV